MRTLLIALALAIPATAATAGAREREAITSAIIDAGVHGALCHARDWKFNDRLMANLMVNADMAQSEMDALPGKLRAAVAEMRGQQPEDVVCRDAEERYGAGGTIIPDLLVTAE